MIHKNLILLSSIWLVFLYSCEKKDKPIKLPPRGDGQVLQVDMGEDYDYQFFISLKHQKVVHISRSDMWDIAFQNGTDQHGVFLNGGKGMAAYKTSKTNFADVHAADTLISKDKWTYDAPNGSIDSTAIGDWYPKSNVYLIRMNESGSKIRKLQIIEVDPLQYVIAVSDLQSTVPFSVTILKNQKFNFTYFSFDQLKTVPNVEPEKTSWDLQATRYHVTFYNETPVLHYMVTGLLTNPYNTAAYKDSVLEYANLDKQTAESLVSYNDRNVIGFDWKNYDLNMGVYTVVKKYNYLIRNQDNLYFKLRFLDFYSSSGVKGSPKFEFNQLQ
jgi:hypothetical protein